MPPPGPPTHQCHHLDHRHTFAPPPPRRPCPPVPAQGPLPIHLSGRTSSDRMNYIHRAHTTRYPMFVRDPPDLQWLVFLSGPPRTGPSLNAGPPHSTRHSMARPAGPLSHASRHGTRPDPDTCPHYSPAHRLSVRTGPPPRLRLGSRPRYPARHTPPGTGTPHSHASPINAQSLPCPPRHPQASMGFTTYHINVFQPFPAWGANRGSSIRDLTGTGAGQHEAGNGRDQVTT